jgi:hypothetical protein
MSVKTRNMSKVIGLVCASIILSIANPSLTIGDGIVDNFSLKRAYSANPGYKPVSDTCPYVENGEGLSDNFLYKEWCEETFDNGNYIYESYKDIAFNIKYTPESGRTDYWQTPVETARLKKGDCEDAVFLFFSQLPSNQINAEIVWGWVINKQSTVGRAHVWYQLLDKKGQQYVVEGFSNDWNGIIPIEIIEETESRKPIFTISHSAISRLVSSLPKVDNSQIIMSLVDSPAVTNFSNHDSAKQPFSQGVDTLLLPNTTKEISNILDKLHKLFSRYERQKAEANTQAAYKSKQSQIEYNLADDRNRAGIRKFYPARNLMCKR